MSSVGRELSLAVRRSLGLCTLIVLLAGASQIANAKEGPPATSVLSAPVSVVTPPSESLVIGFMGGFVSRNASHHAEVKLIQSLRGEYSSDVYFGMYENRRQDEAYAMIREHLDSNRDGQLSEEEKNRAHILLFGHSWGAYAVVALARRLNREGIPVMLTVQVDSVAKPFRNDSVIPANVHQAVNFYQTRGWIHGRRKISAADPVHTEILGNFRLDYKEQPSEECSEYPRSARWLMKGHIAIECDPQVWSQVKTLLRSQLPPIVVTDNTTQQTISAVR